MKILKFTDFVSSEVLNEGYNFINEEDEKQNEMEYVFSKDGLLFDFTDLFTNYINKK